MLIGEIAGVTSEEYDLSTDPERQECDMIITFEHMMVDTDYDKLMGKFKARDLSIP